VLVQYRTRISGGFRSLGGAEDFVVSYSMPSSGKKKQSSVLPQTLASGPTHLIAKLRLA